MKLPAILASDLHLTSNPAEKYRWGLFPWLIKEAEAEKAKTLILLGDITDAKDYHGAELVNQIVYWFDMLKKAGLRVVVLRGNHDYLRDGHMYLEFLRAIGVEVITKPTEDTLGELCMYLPFTRTPMKDWQGMDFSHYRYVFMHQTAPGSVASNGQKMDGDALPVIGAAKVYSGDIHVPQTIGQIEYVGSPYHVHFGDNFKPRCIVIEPNGNAVDLHFPSPRRVMLNVDGMDDFCKATMGLHAGDQVRVRVALPEADKHRWRAVKAEIEAEGAQAMLELVGIELRVQKSSERAAPGDRPVVMFDPVECLYNYVESRELGGELLDVALECMEQAEI